MQPDPWGFEDAPVETWADVLRPQALDLALLAAFIALAIYSFRRKSVPLKFVTFAAAIGYLGFAKSYLISITNIFSIVDWNWPVVKYNLAWYLFFGFAVVSTVLWGRLYCGRRISAQVSTGASSKPQGSSGCSIRRSNAVAKADTI